MLQTDPASKRETGILKYGNMYPYLGISHPRLLKFVRSNLLAGYPAASGACGALFLFEVDR